MAKISRATHIVFGSGGSTDNFAKFGSLIAGSPLTTKDLSAIQALPAWTNGFQDALYTSNKAILLEDLNGFALEHSAQVGYILEMGIPEWDSGTPYFLNSVVQDAAGNGQQFRSLQDNNLNHTPPASASNAYWLWLNPPAVQDDGLTANCIPMVSVPSASPAVLVPSYISQDANNVILAKQIQFPDGSTQGVSAAPVTSQGVGAGAKGSIQSGVGGLDSIYKNNTGKTIFVSVAVYISTGPVSAIAYCDANAAPTQAVAYGSAAVGSSAGLSFVVLPGYYYKVPSTGGLTLTNWVEWN